MTYEHHYLREWLLEHDLIPTATLERRAGLSKDTLNHFINERRGFPEKHYDKVVEILTPYGFKTLTAE